MIRSALRHLAALVLCLPAMACGGGWQAVPSPWPETLPPRQQVEIWSGPRVTRLHGVVTTTDSIFGIPFLKPLSCDSCRVSLERASIDSLRTGDMSGGVWATIGLVALGVLVGLLAVCETGYQGCPLSGST